MALSRMRAEGASGGAQSPALPDAERRLCRGRKAERERTPETRVRCRCVFMTCGRRGGRRCGASETRQKVRRTLPPLAPGSSRSYFNVPFSTRGLPSTLSVRPGICDAKRDFAAPPRNLPETSRRSSASRNGRMAGRQKADCGLAESYMKIAPLTRVFATRKDGFHEPLASCNEITCIA